MSTQNGQILTVNPMGVFIDETPTLKYNGVYLAGLGHFNMGLVDGILEIQVMQSDVSGRYGMPGNPTPSATGIYTWLRAKTDNGVWSDWLYRSGAAGLNEGATLTSRSALVDTFVLASKKRRDFHAMMFANLVSKNQQLLGKTALNTNGKKLG
ncbi:MAG: hypothetical protein J5613_05170 [Alphaproteobacteria bacterium]|nr:hypothetical protein [Alphaproteobacteria bacterium]